MILWSTEEGGKDLKTHFPNNDLILAGSEPTSKGEDNSALVDGDLWINTSDLENYPRIYRRRSNAWSLVDNTDQTTPRGIVFADARQDIGSESVTVESTTHAAYSSTSAALMNSNYVDPDAPDYKLYPNGLLLFNTRHSTLNVKEFKPNHLAVDSSYEVGGTTYEITSTRRSRWVSRSGNKADGSPYMGRKAQRRIVVQSLADAVVSNDDLRSNTVSYTLIAAPGYVELLDEMQSLNTDRKLTAFIVGDTPSRLNPGATYLQEWATNAKNSPSNDEDGLTSSDTYTGLYYSLGIVHEP